MKKFEFPLERVLEYRTHLQKNEKAILSDLQAQHRKLCEERDEIAERLTACCREYVSACVNGALVSELRTYIIYKEELRRQLEAQERAIWESQNRIDRQMQKVVAANKDKRGLEILKDKQSGIYLTQIRKEDERFLEEFVVTSGVPVIRQ